MNDTPLILALRDGRKLTVSTARCGSCDNEWYVPGPSEEFFPKYCCYCGIHFIRRIDTICDVNKDS